MVGCNRYCKRDAMDGWRMYEISINRLVFALFWPNREVDYGELGLSHSWISWKSCVVGNVRL